MLDTNKLLDYLDEQIENLESKEIKVGSWQDGSDSAFRAVRLLVKRAIEESE